MVQAAPPDQASHGTGVFWWTLAGLGLYPVGFVASMLVIATIEQLILDPMGIRAQAGEVSLSIRNGLHHVVWGAAVAAVAVPIGRRLVPATRFERAGVAVLAVGLVLAALAELLIIEFDRTRNGYFDPDHVGLAIAVPPAMVAVALASWAAMAIPRPSRAPLVVLAAVAAIGFVLALLPSIGGLADGIDPESIPLALCLVVSAAFVVLAPMVARR